MFTTTSKKYVPANFVFSAQFTAGVDVKTVQETINCYLSMYSQYKLTGTRDPKENDGTLGWNLIGLGMDSDFDVDRFLDDMSNHINGIDGISAIIFTEGEPRHYLTPGLGASKQRALSHQCFVQLDKGSNPNHSLTIH